MSIYAGRDRVLAIPSRGNGGAAASPLLFENSVVVSENGNDATGQRNNWNKPFRNFDVAITNAVAGDCIFVMPGAYSNGLTISKALNFHFFDGATLTGYVNVAANLTFTNARVVNNDSGGGWCFQMSGDDVILNLHHCTIVGAKDGIKRQLGFQDWRINLYNCDFDTVDDCLQFPVSGGDRGKIYGQDSRFKSLYQPAEMGNFSFHFRNCTFDNRLNTVVTNMGAIDCIPLPGQAGETIGVVDSCLFLNAPDAVSTISRDNATHAIATPTGAKYLFSNCQSNKPWGVNSDFEISNCIENALYTLL